MDDPHEATPQTPEEIFGAELRRLRERSGLTVRQLADALHRAHSGIVEYEGGRRLPSVEVCEQYEEHFGLTRGTLVAPRERARVLRQEDPADATLGEHLGDAAAPYKGLRAFGLADASLFFGREAQVAEVLTRLSKVRFVAIVGPSGSGKSSFVRAGLVGGIGAAAGAGATRPRVVTLTPGERPVEALAAAVCRAGAPIGAEDLRSDPQCMEEIARDSDAGLVIVVDQLEELFTLCHEDGERRCFLDALMASWRDPASPVSVILALRADFYGRVAAYPELAAAVVAHQTLIGPMSPHDLRRAIELPAAATGLLLQPGLAETMLDDLAGEPGALPLLSHALLETWKRRRRLMLTVGGYREAGGVRGAIAQTAERTLQTLTDADRVIARSIFLRLSDVGASAEPTRLRVARTALAAGSAARDRVIGILADARLLTLEESTVVVAHEALIRHWPRLRGWIDADRDGLLMRRRLAEAAGEWHSLGRDAGALYRGPRLAAATEWAAESEDELSPTERDFLRASVENERAERELAQRRAQRLRRLAIGLATTTVVVAVLALVALEQRGTARHEADEATSLALASASKPLLASRPDISLLLALGANRASERVEARASMMSALLATRDPRAIAIMRGHRGGVNDVAFSPDAPTLATAGNDHTVRLWDARDQKELGPPLAGHTAKVLSVAFAPGGRTLASVGADRTIRLWDLRTHNQLGTSISTRAGARSRVVFDPAGRTLALAGSDGAIRLWDVATQRQIGPPLKAGKQVVDALAFSPDGRTLAAGGDDGHLAGSLEDEAGLRLWEVSSHRQLGAALIAHGATIHSLAFSPDGHTLASAGGDYTISLWDVATHRSRGAALDGHSDIVVALAFRPDGRTLASASKDATVRVWDMGTRKQLAVLHGHSAGVSGVAFAPDGRTLASSSLDVTVRLWDLRTPYPAPFSASSSVLLFSRDGHTLASAAPSDPKLRLWDARTYKPLGPPLAVDTGTSAMAFSPDSRAFAFAGVEPGVHLWDLRRRTELAAPLTVGDQVVRSVAFSPDGRTLAVAASGLIHMWDVRARKLVGRPMTASDESVLSVEFSPDGRTLASGHFDGMVRLWDARTHKQIGAPIAAHAGRQVERVRFSPDGRALASGGWDGTVRLWDVRTHKQLGRPMIADPAAVEGVQFSPDGSTLASVGSAVPDSLRLWDVRTHDQLAELPHRTLSLYGAVALHPNGRDLALADEDDGIGLRVGVFWDSVATLRARVCSFVGHGLTRAEWARYARAIPYRETC